MRAVLSLACWLTAAAAACAGGSAPAAPGPAEPVQVALRDLAGKEWVLQSWDADEAAPASPRVTLTYKDDRFSGRSGCNQYWRRWPSRRSGRARSSAPVRPPSLRVSVTEPPSIPTWRNGPTVSTKA